MKSFRDINIVFPDGVRKGSITFDERSILSFEASENALSLPEGVYLAPGFLDEHIHGACGRDAMDGEPESILRIAEALVQEGVTSFLPTTMTETIPAIEKSLLSIQEAKKKQTSGANIAGIHLEGPFISPIFKGAQAEINIQKPNLFIRMKIKLTKMEIALMLILSQNLHQTHYVVRIIFVILAFSKRN